MPLHPAGPAAVTALDALTGIGLVALGLLVGVAVTAWRLAPPLSLSRGRVLPAVLAALAVAGVVALSFVSWSDKAAHAQALAALGIVALTLLLWATGPKRCVAVRDLTIEQRGDEEVIEEGEWVTAEVAKRPEAAERFTTQHVAKEDFRLGDDTVAKGDVVAERDAGRPEVKEHVRLVRKATQRIAFSDVTVTKIAKGAEVPEDLRTQDNVKERVIFAPGRLFIGQDGRWSTSKLTALLWTLAVGWALVSLLIATQALDLPLALPGGEKRFADLELPDAYYLLLGGPFAAALLAKAFTSTKVENGTVVKMEKPAEGDPIAGLQQVLSNDENTNDLVDSQYFLFNLVALAYFLVEFIGGLDGGLPDIPEPLFGLTSAAALAYTTKKGLERDVPLVLSASPSAVRAGETITVWGRNLAPGGALPVVEIGGRPAQATLVLPSSQPGTDELRVGVPALPSGNANLVVTPAGGRPTAPFALTAQAAAVTAVAPEPIPLRAGQRIAITGSGFGGTAGTVALGGTGMTVRSWSPTSIVAEVAERRRYPVTGGKTVLEVSSGAEVAVRETAAEAIVVSGVEPKSVKKGEAARVVVTGRGFAANPVVVTLGGEPAQVVSGTDTQLVLALDPGADYPTGAARLIVSDPALGYEAAADVTLTPP